MYRKHSSEATPPNANPSVPTAAQAAGDYTPCPTVRQGLKSLRRTLDAHFVPIQLKNHFPPDSIGQHAPR